MELLHIGLIAGGIVLFLGALFVVLLATGALVIPGVTFVSSFSIDQVYDIAADSTDKHKVVMGNYTLVPNDSVVYTSIGTLLLAWMQESGNRYIALVLTKDGDRQFQIIGPTTGAMRYKTDATNIVDPVVAFNSGLTISLGDEGSTLTLSA